MFHQFKKQIALDKTSEIGGDVTRGTSASLKGLNHDGGRPDFVGYCR